MNANTLSPAQRRRTRRLAALLLTATALSACGGGGGSGSNFGDMNGSGATGNVATRGAITGFGSVIVEGQRFETTDAQIIVNEVAAGQSALRVGQVIDIRGVRSADGTLVAERLRYDATIVGPIESIDLDARSIRVNGQEVRVTAETVIRGARLESLQPGERVEVSAERFDDLFVASFIERRDDDDDEVEVTGPVRDLDEAAMTFFVGGQEVDFSAAQLELDDGGMLADGVVVEVKGTLDGMLLRASRVKREDDFDDDLDEDTEIEVVGIVGGLDAEGNFVIQGLRARLTPQTEFDDGSRADLANGVRVKVEGRTDADGVLLADEVELLGGGAPGAGGDAPGAAGRGIIELEGRVQAAGTDFVEVFGLRIAIDARTRISDDAEDDDEGFASDRLQPGDFVEIAAVVEAERLVALRLEREDEEADEEDRLRGIIDDSDGMQTLTVSGVDVVSDAATEFEDANDTAISGADFFASARAGDAVDVRGLFDGNAIAAERIAFRNPSREDFSDDLERDEVENGGRPEDDEGRDDGDAEREDAADADRDDRPGSGDVDEPGPGSGGNGVDDAGPGTGDDPASDGGDDDDTGSGDDSASSDDGSV